MTPCERLGYKVGDRFVAVTASDGTTPEFEEGSIVELERDDGSHMPLFKLISGDCPWNNAKGGRSGAFEYLGCVQKLQESPCQTTLS